MSHLLGPIALSVAVAVLGWAVVKRDKSWIVICSGLVLSNGAFIWNPLLWFGLVVTFCGLYMLWLRAQGREHGR